ncbi:phosphoribosyl-ATP pyrophosphohydrolase [Candidatus Vidania fulgoroideae]|nr:phosphoribosyl-ATP pyrophosphohydrolase [Candidatus Vidania fulgoroideae]
MFKRLIKVILKSRKKKSYCRKMLKNSEKMRRKLLEESYELVRETLMKKKNKKRMVEESCDIIFHLCLILIKYKVNIKDIFKEMISREEPN